MSITMSIALRRAIAAAAAGSLLTAMVALGAYRPVATGPAHPASHSGVLADGPDTDGGPKAGILGQP